MPPPLACPLDGRATALVAAARTLASAMEAELGLDSAASAGEGVLLAQLRERAGVHNQRQDAAAAAGAARLEARRGLCAAPSSSVRRRRDGEAKSDRTDAGEEVDEDGGEGGGGGGLMARAEFADALFATLGRLTTVPCAVSSFDDAPLLCEFGKACFAQVCVDLGLLVIERPS